MSIKKVKQITPGKARWKLNDRMWDSKSITAEPKVDGSRYLMHVGPEISRFTSRHISKKTGEFTEKTDNVPHLRDYFTNEGVSDILQGCVFDGEIVRGGLLSKSSSVTEIMGSSPEKAILLQQENSPVDYYVFDILYDRDNDVRCLSYETRRKILLDRLSGLADLKKHFDIIPTETQNKKQFYEDILEQGGEGVILKDTQAPYAKNWAKVKRSATYDVVIMGYEDPTEITKKSSGEESISHYAEKGWIGSIIFGQYFQGKLIEFGRTSGIDEALREELSINGEKYIGKVIEIGCQERILKTGKFRHPRFIQFRPDKNPQDCVYRAGEC